MAVVVQLAVVSWQNKAVVVLRACGALRSLVIYSSNSQVITIANYKFSRGPVHRFCTSRMSWSVAAI